MHHGRHFCRTIHAMCNIHALLTQSIIRVVEELPDENLTAECVVRHLLKSHIMTSFLPPPSRSERREHKVFEELLRTIPNLEERIMTGSEEDLTEIADQVSTILTIRTKPSYLVASQRCNWGQRRRHEDSQRQYFRVDHAERPVPQPTPLPKPED